MDTYNNRYPWKQNLLRYRELRANNNNNLVYNLDQSPDN